MAEIEITLPTVQYGNVKITATPEEWGLDTVADAPDVGVWAATYLNLFVQGFKVGAAMDVDAHLEAPQGASVPEAQELLDKGLGGVTELPEAETVTQSPPWTEPAVDAKPKPWEQKAEKAKPVVSSGW